MVCYTAAIKLSYCGGSRLGAKCKAAEFTKKAQAIDMNLNQSANYKN